MSWRKCGPMDVCYCTPRCKDAGSGLPKPKYPSAQKTIDALRKGGVHTVTVGDTVGFLGSEGYTFTERRPINPDGADAAWLIERLLMYVQHDVGCHGNDLDPLDDAPCTCGLRAIMRGDIVRRPAPTKEQQ